jgi:hypothetical protein
LFSNHFFPAAGLEAAWINDLQRRGLESGVNRLSPGRYSVDRALARLAEEVRLGKQDE